MSGTLAYLIELTSHILYFSIISYEASKLFLWSKKINELRFFL
jgi:hypothetical protein